MTAKKDPLVRRGRPVGTGVIGLNPDLAAALIKERQGLMTDRDCAMKHGISLDQLKYVLKEGLKEGALPIYREFAEDWAHARLNRKNQLLERVEAASKDMATNKKSRGEFRAATWLLEKTFARDYGPEATNLGNADLEELIREEETQAQNLDSLLADPPEQLVDAIKRNAAALRQLLDEIDPTPPPDATET